MKMIKNCTYKTIAGDRYEAKIHLDPYNSRARLLDYQGDANKTVEELKRICRKHGFGKLICMAYRRDQPVLLDNGLVSEGEIDGYFKGETAVCLSYFFDLQRQISGYLEKEDEIIAYCAKYQQQGDLQEESDSLRTAGKEDAGQIARLMAEVFPDYPTPMDDPEYIQKMMDEDVLFKMIEIDGKLVSIASADMSPKFLNAEITDCATHPSFRGKGCLNKLIFALERDLKRMGYITAFSLARARSYGMNIVLSKHGYEYGGRHINNCRIMNGFEDMNIWAKRL